MYSRYLFIGLGGSGGKTLRFLKRDIKKWMEKNGIENPKIPDGWQFLHIDTPTNPDGEELNSIVPQISPDEYLGLIGQNLEIDEVQQALDHNTNYAPEQEGWRIDPQGLNVGLSKGAGQYRAIGRTVAIWGASRIEKRIKQISKRVNHHNVSSELKELYSKVTGELASGQPPLRIIVISSLAGGSGAGLLTDTCDILRASPSLGSEGSETFGILYTPEVFESLGGDATGGVQANTLAAISEVLNGHWYGGDPLHEANSINPRTVPQIEDRILKDIGLAGSIEQSGPAYPFLIGRVGEGGIDHGTPERLFEMVGRSILSWMTSQNVEAKFISFTIGNWNQFAKNRASSSKQDLLVNDGLRGEQGLPAFSSLGYSRLSVGVDYFKEYCVQRIIKMVNEFVVTYNYASQEAHTAMEKKSTQEVDIITKAIAEHHKPPFMRKAGLSEVGKTYNQIQDAIEPENAEDLVRSFRKDVERMVLSGNQPKQSGAEWVDTIENAIKRYQKEFEAKYQLGLDKASEEWVGDITSKILNAVEETISECGLEATAQVCMLASDELENDLDEDLQGEESRARKHALKYDEAFAELHDKTKIDSNNEILKQAIRDATKQVAVNRLAMRAQRSRTLSGEVSKRVIRPMSRYLSDAQREAKNDLEDMSTLVPWSDNPPPKIVLPPAGEFPLIDPNDFPKLFKSLMQRTFKGSIDDEDGRKARVRSDIIAGTYLRKDADKIERPDDDAIRHLLTISPKNEWWPDADSFSQKAQDDLRVEVRMNEKELRMRTESWLQQEGSAFGEFLDTGLRDYLGNTKAAFSNNKIDNAELDDRKARFFAQLDAAILSSAPLINVSKGTLGVVHKVENDGVGAESVFSEIPLDSHDLTASMTSKLREFDLDDTDIDSILTADGKVEHIDITSFIPAALSPLVIDSLLRPIADDRQQAEMQGENAMQGFWEFRRARPLKRFVPVPQAVLASMIRGWFTARFLGLIKVEAGEAFEIARDGNTTAKFPYPLLTTNPAPMDYLPAVLEALPLSYVEVNLNGKLSPLDAYKTLRDLGKEVPGPTKANYVYNSLSPELKKWVETGEFPNSISDPTLKGSHIPSGEEGVKHRIDLLEDHISAGIASYEKEFEEHKHKINTDPSALSGEPHWPGLRHEIEKALKDLKGACKAAKKDLSKPSFY